MSDDLNSTSDRTCGAHNDQSVRAHSTAAGDATAVGSLTHLSICFLSSSVWNVEKVEGECILHARHLSALACGRRLRLSEIARGYRLRGTNSNTDFTSLGSLPRLLACAAARAASTTRMTTRSRASGRGRGPTPHESHRRSSHTHKHAGHLLHVCGCFRGAPCGLRISSG